MTRKPQAPGLGPLDDPLANWPNDDLLLEQKSRNRVAREHPDLLKILDWPELRAAFEDTTRRLTKRIENAGDLAAPPSFAALPGCCWPLWRLS